MEDNPPPCEKVTVPPSEPADPPSFEPPPLLSDCLAGSQSDLIDEAVDDALAETFPPGSRKPRHDGWTPEVVAGFLRHLAATGVVDHAARAVNRSAASAYAFRNRRQGRAFAKMWDAVLVHRARARVASELQGRAIAGCVSVRRRNGEVVGEYHYHDNRLAMSLLTRLDRLAEREQESEAHLRTLSEDLDDFCDHLAQGGDADAFVEARRPVLSEAEGPVEPEPAPAPPKLPPDDHPDLTDYARMRGCRTYRNVHPFDIEVRDLDATRQDDWSPDQWVRFFRSGLAAWLGMRKHGDPGYRPGPGAALRYHILREASSAAAESQVDGAEGDAARASEIGTSDLDPARLRDWTDEQLARAFNSHLLHRLPDRFWDDLALGGSSAGAEE